MGASKNANPDGVFYLYAIEACTTYSNPSGGSGYPHDLGDHPIMGISHGYNGIDGRVVIDVICHPTDTLGNIQPSPDGDEIFDIDIGTLESDGSLGGGTSCTGSCGFFTSTSPKFLRPANNYGTYKEIILSSEVLSIGTSLPQLYLYQIIPQSTLLNDKLSPFDPRNPSSPQPFVASTQVWSGTPPPNSYQTLAPQPGCSVSSTCAIQTETLRVNGAAVQTNANGKDIFTASFSALAPDQTDSYYFAFVLNDSNGTNKFVATPVTNGIIGFTAATLDPDQEVAVNYTTFTSSGSSSSIDLINANPISSAGVVSTQASVASSSSALPSYSCSSASAVCR